MISQISALHPLLQPYVSQYLYMQNTFPVPIQAPCIPRGLCACMFPLREVKSQTICRESANNVIFNCEEIYLFGQATEVQWVTANGHMEMLFAVLKPTALYQLMREQANIFTDKVVKLSEWFPHTRSVVEQINATKSLSDKLPIINNYLLNLFKKTHTMAGEVDSSLYTIFESSGIITMQNLAKKERLSERTLQRKFNEKIGVSPKSYARIIRFRSLMQYLLNHQEASLLDLACLFNYHDHSHLIKDFHHFTGNTPALYLNQAKLTDRYFLKYL